MVKGLYAAYTGMLNEEHRMDVITNNLANIDTNGYKKEGMTSQAFSDVLGYKIKDLSEAPATARYEGILNLGVKIGEGYTDFSQGPYRQTGNTYDVALSGSGFFTIEYTNKAGETSTMYTRDGDFTLTQAGELVTRDGDFVLDPNGNHIVLDPLADAQINQAGLIFQNGNQAGQIGLTDFENYDFLEHYGENFFYPVDGATQIPATARVDQGFLEQSNVSTVDEMVNMIALQRHYETNQRMITTIDGTLQIAANDLGRLQ